MSKINEFLNELGSLPGVDSYLLVNDGGQLVTKTKLASEELGAAMQVILLASRKIQTSLGMKRLRHLNLADDDGGRLLIFPLGRYLLGISQLKDQVEHDLSALVPELIKRFQSKAQ